MGRHSLRPPDDQPTQQITPRPVVARVPVSTFGTGLTIRQRKVRDNVRDALIMLALLAAALVGVWLIILGMTP